MPGRRVAVLDGGFPRWREEGRPVESGEPSPVRRHFTARLRPELVTDLDGVRRNLTTRLAQVVSNLLDNALKYSEGSIELVVSQADHVIDFAVHDRGDGIPAGQEHAIFEPYFRSDRSGQRGAGLGLAVCRAIARAHHGELAVAARAGGGTSFVLRLPVEVPQPVPEAA